MVTLLFPRPIQLQMYNLGRLLDYIWAQQAQTVLLLALCYKTVASTLLIQIQMTPL